MCYQADKSDSLTCETRECGALREDDATIPEIDERKHSSCNSEGWFADFPIIGRPSTRMRIARRLPVRTSKLKRPSRRGMTPKHCTLCWVPYFVLGTVCSSLTGGDIKVLRSTFEVLPPYLIPPVMIPKCCLEAATLSTGALAQSGTPR